MDPSTSQAGVQCLGDFREEAKRFDLETFSIQLGEAFLLHHGPLGKLRITEDLPSTMVIEVPATVPGRPFNPQADFLVFPVRRKAPPQPGDDAILVGRSADNDVFIPDDSISTVHACISRGAGGTFLVQDMSSKNGSFVNEVTVPVQNHGDPVVIESGDRVRLGTVNLSFLAASEFRHLVNTLLS